MIKQEEKDDFDVISNGLLQVKQSYASSLNGDFVYFITDGDATKIGLSGDTDARLSTLQIANYVDLHLAHRYQCAFAKACEDELHQLFQHVHVRGEWYKLSQTHIALIKGILKPLRYEQPLLECRFPEVDQRPKKRKRAFTDFVKAFSDIVDVSSVQGFLQEQALLKHGDDADEYERTSLLPIFMKGEQASVLDRTLLERTLQDMSPIFTILSETPLDRYKEERLLRLLQYRLFTPSAGWTPVSCSSSAGSDLLRKLRGCHDLILENLIEALASLLGIKSFLPPESSERIKEGNFVIDFRDRTLLCMRIEPKVFTENALALKEICMKIRRRIHAHLPRYDDVIMHVRGTVTVLFGAFLKKKKGATARSNPYFRVIIDPAELAWARDFCLLTNQLP